jgi:hypothetical protein
MKEIIPHWISIDFYTTTAITLHICTVKAKNCSDIYNLTNVVYVLSPNIHTKVLLIFMPVNFASSKSCF